MIIDKVKPFYTDEDKRYIAERWEAAKAAWWQGAVLANEAAQPTGDDQEPPTGDELENLAAEIQKAALLAESVLKENDDRKHEITKRYIASFSNDTQAVLADAAEILDAIEKSDYIKYIESEKDKIEFNEKYKEEPSENKKKQTAPRRCYKDFVKFLSIQTNIQRVALYLIHQNTTGEQVILSDTELPPPVKGIPELDNLIDAKAQKFYKKPKGAASKTKAELVERYQAPEAYNLFTLPTSPALNLITEMFIHGRNLKGLPERKHSFNNSARYEIQGQGNSRRLTETTAKGTVMLEIPDINQVIGNNKTAKKFFTFAIIKANEQAIFNGDMGRNFISFPLQELVSLGMYKSEMSARQGFNAGADILTSLKIKGSMQKSPKSTAAIDALEVLFTGANIKNGQCTIYLNERINWSFLFQYFTIIPREALKLQNRAFDLCVYIFTRARQLKDKVKKDGFFTISFRSIHERLALPSEVGNRKPQQQIKQPIDDAIQNIEETLQNTDIELLTIVNEDAPIKEWLDQGYLKVSLKGDYATLFIELSNEQQKQIANKQKRKDRITEKAIALKMATSDKISGGESEITS